MAKHYKAGKLLTSILSAFGQLLYVQPATVKKEDCNENQIKVVSNNKYNFAHNTNYIYEYPIFKINGIKKLKLDIVIF